MDSMCDIEIPLDWYVRLKLERFIPERDMRLLNKAHALALKTVGLFFEQFPEFEIVGSMVSKYSKVSDRQEVHYQPVLMAARQGVLDFDPSRKANLERLLVEKLEELQDLPVRLTAISRMSRLKSMNSPSERADAAIRTFRALLNSKMGNSVSIGSMDFQKPEPLRFREWITCEFSAAVNRVGLDFVQLEEIKLTHAEPLLGRLKTLRVNFNACDRFDDSNTYSEIFNSLMIKNQRATLLCEITIKEQDERRWVENGRLLGLYLD